MASPCGRIKVKTFAKTYRAQQPSTLRHHSHSHRASAPQALAAPQVSQVPSAPGTLHILLPLLDHSFPNCSQGRCQSTHPSGPFLQSHTPCRGCVFPRDRNRVCFTRQSKPGAQSTEAKAAEGLPLGIMSASESQRRLKFCLLRALLA